jgi:hypothetical protein
MNKIDIEKLFQMLTNLAVIVGILFLGVEIHQNNELLRFQRSLSSLQVQLSVTSPSIDDPDMRRATERMMTGQELSQIDTQMLRGSLSRILLTMEWQYKEVPEERERARKTFVTIMNGLPLARDLWNDMKAELDADFVNYFEAEFAENE